MHNTRYVLVIRAPGLGLTEFDRAKKNDWIVIERRSHLTEINTLFERAALFLEDRGEAVVVSQRIVGRDVETRIHKRHRVEGSVDPRDFTAGDLASVKVFWNRVGKTVREQDAAKPIAPIKKAPPPPRPNQSWDFWRPILRNLQMIGLFSLCCATAGWFFSNPTSGTVIEFMIELVARQI